MFSQLKLRNKNIFLHIFYVKGKNRETVMKLKKIVIISNSIIDTSSLVGFFESYFENTSVEFNYFDMIDNTAHYIRGNHSNFYISIVM